jgi:hypothetical protein
MQRFYFHLSNHTKPNHEKTGACRSFEEAPHPPARLPPSGIKLKGLRPRHPGDRSERQRGVPHRRRQGVARSRGLTAAPRRLLEASLPRLANLAPGTRRTPSMRHQ